MLWRRVDLVLKEASDVLWGACSARKTEDQVRISSKNSIFDFFCRIFEESQYYLFLNCIPFKRKSRSKK
jgi:hypothetical protein